MELCHRSFLTDGYVQLLETYAMSHFFNIHPPMPSIREQMAIVPLGACLVGLCWMLGQDRTCQEARERYAPFKQRVDPAPLVRIESGQVSFGDNFGPNPTPNLSAQESQ